MGVSDRVAHLILIEGSSVTTSATDNVIGAAWVRSGSTLTLGADLNARRAFFDGSEYIVELSGENSTLDARGHKITTNTLSIGWEIVGRTQEPGIHVVNFLNRGDLEVQGLYVANQGLNLTATDRVGGFVLANGSTTFTPTAAVNGLDLRGGSTATTAAVGNIKLSVFVRTGSTLTLGADLNVNQLPGIDGGVVVSFNSTLDAQGHRITAGQLQIGWGAGDNSRLLNRGDLAVTELYVGNQDFDLTAADQVSTFYLSNGRTSIIPVVTVPGLSLQNGATAATSVVGNITDGVHVLSGSALTLGADLSVAGQVVVHGNNSTLDARGHNITAEELTVAGNSSSALLNRGNLAVAYLSMSDQSINLTAADRVTSFALYRASSNLGTIAGIENLELGDGATAVTTSAGNITRNVTVGRGSTLTLGADLGVSGTVQITGGNSTLDARGHTITAETLQLGFFGGSGDRLLNKGNLAVTNFILSGQNMDLSAADRVTNLTILPGLDGEGSAVSTAATGNVTGSVQLPTGSTLTLGADLVVTGAISARNSTIDARGHNITASLLDLTYFASNPGDPNVRLLNDGAVTVTGDLALSGGVRVELHDGNDSAQGLIMSSDGDDLRVKAAATGLTISGPEAYNLFLSDSTLTLELDGRQPGWVMRWANPEGGDHVADLTALIAQDSIVFDVTNGGEYSLVSRDGYTYIVQPVPEPGLILLLAAPVAVGLCRRRAPKKWSSSTS
jgi:hypothetical protein